MFTPRDRRLEPGSDTPQISRAAGTGRVLRRPLTPCFFIRLVNHLVEHAEDDLLGPTAGPLFGDRPTKPLELGRAVFFVAVHFSATCPGTRASNTSAPRAGVELLHDLSCFAELLDHHVVLVLVDGALELRVVVPRLHRETSG